MAKLKVGVDLDKTLFNCKSVLYTFLNRLHINKDKKLKHREIERDGEKLYKCSFANKVFKLLNPNFYFTFPNAVETINSLSARGFEVHIVSNRPSIRPLVALTLVSLQNQGVKYDKLVLGCNNKQAYAKEAGLDYFVDNMEEVCLAFEEKTNVKAVCFKPVIKTERKEKLSRFATTKFASWVGIDNFFRQEQKKIETAEMVVCELKKRATNTLISRGLCLPEPQKQK